MTISTAVERIKPEDFIKTDSGIWVDIYNFPDENGRPKTRINWYDSKLTAKQYGLILPTSNEWGDARKYLQENDTEKEKLFISGPSNWIDSLIVFPKNKQYPRGVEDLLKDLLGSKVSKYPIIMERTDVEKDGDNYVLLKSPDTKSHILQDLPLKDGYIQDWNDNLDLPTKVGSKPNPEYFGTYYWVTSQGIRPVLRGRWFWLPHVRRRFDMDAAWGPLDSREDVGFRLASKEDPKVLISDKTRRVK